MQDHLKDRNKKMTIILILLPSHLINRNLKRIIATEIPWDFEKA